MKKELTAVAAQYAAEKTNEVMINAIAKAYADGYRDGYKDREEEIPVDLRTNETEYVNLGLPSGTLWPKSYETIDRKILCLTYGEASNYDIPSVKQWKELMSDKCEWKYYKKGNYFECLGPNGDKITFPAKVKRLYISSKMIEIYELEFWLMDESASDSKNVAHVFAVEVNRYDFDVKRGIAKKYPGNKLPLCLVQTRQGETNV